ncbi:hypothetical protein NPIL_33731 [Nephila pilipes]|uniref:Uncharacterized protein n=1 Tax=Nephila pilipes TaxID=299642 RepID=A0A8X6R545_NEPPI|nr:hypothetical protein NPIL_33731 [Nephila pilipes]
MIAKRKRSCRSMCETFEFMRKENESLDKAFTILSQIHMAIKSMKCRIKHKPLSSLSDKDRLTALNDLDEGFDVLLDCFACGFEEIEDKTETLHSILFKDVSSSIEKDVVLDLFDDIGEIQTELSELISESEEKMYTFLHSIQKENRKTSDNNIVLVLNV